jgi:hypothetical protein
MYTHTHTHTHTHTNINIESLKGAGHWWLTPIILITWVADGRLKKKSLQDTISAQKAGHDDTPPFIQRKKG